MAALKSEGNITEKMKFHFLFQRKEGLIWEMVYTLEAFTNISRKNEH